MTEPTQITDHVARAQATQKSHFDDSPQLRALLQVFVDEIQLIDDVAFDVLVKSVLDIAEGAQLDQWGKVFGELRGSLDDDEYRTILKAVSAAHQSDAGVKVGTLIASTVVGVPVRYIQSGRAAYVLQWVLPAHPDPDYAAAIRRVLDLLKTAGVDYAAYEGTSAGGGVYRLDSGPGLDNGKFARRADIL